jgi:hypothetical protein
MGNNIKPDLQAVEWVWVDWMDLAQPLIEDFKLYMA